MTPENEAVSSTVSRFRAWSQVKGLSQSAAARLLGVSSSTLSQVFSGKYAGSVDRIAEKMVRALDRAERRARAPQRPEFVMTSVAEEVFATLQTAHDEGVMAVVMGPSGTGKTAACLKYAQAEPETILITMRPSGRRGSQGASRPLLARLAAALGVEITYNTSCADAIEATGAALKGTGRLVILDEIDYAAEDVLQAIRMVHDLAEVGFVLVATPAFLERLRSRNSSTLNQFLNRIAYCCQVEGLTDEDADRLLERYSLDRAALAAAREGARGVARRLAFGIVGAQRIAAAENRKLDGRTIARAYAMLMEI
jgi:hypothetical protein